MADVATTYASLASIDASNVYIAAKTYRLVERALVVNKWAESFSLPQRMSKNLRIVRHKRFQIPRGPLTEGTPPDSIAMTIENVDVTVEQWGIVTLLTDVAMITLVHPLLNKAIELSALAMAEMFEREACVILMAGSNVIYGGNRTARSSLVAGDKMNTKLILKGTTSLRARGAAAEGGLYMGALPPQVESDIAGSDITFQNAQNYANVRKLEQDEVGVWGGTRWNRSNFLPLFKGVVAADTAAITTVKAKLLLVNGGGTLADGDYKFVIVARDINSDYERKISQLSAAINTDAGADDSITVQAPSSVNYTYDVYMTLVGGAIAYKVASRVAASASVTITAQAAGTEAVSPVAPADGVEVFVAWVFGKEAFGRVNLDGMSLQSYMTPAGASYTDPLAQGRKVGSKVMFKPFIIANEFFTRFEVTSEFSAELAA
jgi:N4-gp56 family major capsid protein